MKEFIFSYPTKVYFGESMTEKAPDTDRGKLPKVMGKVCIDLVMTVLLMFLMTYELVGQAAHEWLGIGMFVVFVMHHVLNRRWLCSLFKGKYGALRVWQTFLVVLVLFSMLGSMVSGVILSRHALAFLPTRGGRSFARSLHMISAYWGFVFLALHLGFHWNVMMGVAGKLLRPGKRVSGGGLHALRALAFAIAGYGVYAFGKREIGSYMFLKIRFVFFDYEEPLVFFLLDYLAVMGLFVLVGHYITRLIKKC